MHGFTSRQSRCRPPHCNASDFLPPVILDTRVRENFRRRVAVPVELVFLWCLTSTFGRSCVRSNTASTRYFVPERQNHLDVSIQSPHPGSSAPSARMEFTQILLSIFLGAALTLFLHNRLSIYLRFSKAKQKHGCLPPVKYPHTVPLGLDLFFDQFKAMQRGDAEATARQNFRIHGKTFESNSWGTMCIDTMDGKNIQAVLGQSFADFGVEAMRLHIGEPFIGRGVFSTDGSYWKHSRDLIKPMFTKARISNFTALDVYLDRMMERIPRDGSTIDLQPLLKLMV